MANHQQQPLTSKQAKKKTRMFIISLLLCLIALSAYLYWENTTIEVTFLEVVDFAIPVDFDGFTIAHISDLHNTEFGQQQERLLQKLVEAAPDLIAITGDLLDSYHPNITVAMEFINGAIAIAPVYYVTGNHESRLPELYAQLREQMESAGVVVLDNKAVTLEYGSSIIRVLGVDDPTFSAESDLYEDNEQVISAQLDVLLDDQSACTILLSHRPELFDVYHEAGIDLVLCGHAHGGQVRLPFIGALFAPNQGFFPEYTAGLYRQGDTQMVVSRGLGNSSFPIRINNPPELVVITLQAD